MKALAIVLSVAAYGQTVEGTVTNSVTGAPVSGATVQVSGLAGLSATTDQAGAFRLDVRRDGTYSIDLQCKGYAPPESKDRQFVLRSGSEPVRLQLQMMPYGSVSGTVKDGRGEPVAGAVVAVMQSTFNGRTTVTEKDGAFQFDLRPGSYTLSARPLWEMKRPESPEGERRGWVQTWYPGVTYAGAASKIQVPPGTAVSGMDVKLGTAPVHRISGILRDAKGDPAVKLPVRAAQTDQLPAGNLDTTSGSDGSFVFEDVPDGAWQVSAVLDAHDVLLRAYLGATMAGHDVEKLELRLSPPFALTVRLSFDGPPSKTGPVAGVILAPAGGGGVAASRGMPDSEGMLRLEPVYPGAYRITPIRPSGPYYLASVTMGGRDIFGQYIELTGPGLPIEIAYRSDGGTVRGSIENCAGATILLAPQALALRQSELVFAGRCTADGRFEIANVRPGDYYAFAFARFDQMAQEFLAGLSDPSVLNRATAVTVRPREITSLDLKLQ